MIWKKNNKKFSAFTLIEMLIVLIIMGILLMLVVGLSWDQIQKVKDKTVKESILAEMQSRYSRNLWSSSFGGTIYDHLDVEFSTESNKIEFSYYTWTSNNPFLTNSLINNFEVKYMTTNYDFKWNSLNTVDNIKLRYNPYKISCKIWEKDESAKNVIIVTRVNDSRDYCFEIKQENCRLIEVYEDKCNGLKNTANLQ
jgi:prepilin-type N-terminal cleavage/methylation domain-containing protein